MGPGLSRNKGLKYARGKYIAFLDSDDYLVNKQSLELMIEALENNNVDMVSANIEFRNPSTGEKCVGNYLFPVIETKTIFSGDDYGMPWFFYKNIFKKEFLDKHDIVFPELMRGQDTVFLVEVLSKLDNYIHLPITYYSYEEPSTNMLNNFEKFYDYFRSFFDIFKILLSTDHNVSNIYSKVMEFYLAMENRASMITTEDQLSMVIGLLYQIESFLEDKIETSSFNKVRQMHVSLICRLKYEFYKVKVSVIVPVYNVEKYLPICLDSLLQQSLEDIEIICVDDRSTDDSRAILDFYSQKDDRIRIIKNQNKRGSGGSRNRGLGEVRGKYVFFLDSDDWIDPDCLEILYEKSEELNLDMLFFKLINYDDNMNKFYKSDYYEVTPLKRFENKVFNYNDIDKNDFFNITVGPGNKLYSTKFLKKIGAQFPENLIHEDNAFYFEVMFNAERLSFYNYDFYNRRRRKNSITATFDDSLLDSVSIVELIFNYFLENNYYEDYKEPLLNFLCYFIKDRFEVIETKYKPEFYVKAKRFFEKISYTYDLADDMNSLLRNKFLIFYKSIISTENYDQFISKKIRCR